MKIYFACFKIFFLLLETCDSQFIAFAVPHLCGEIYSNKNETSDFHGTVSFDQIKKLQQK